MGQSVQVGTKVGGVRVEWHLNPHHSNYPQVPGQSKIVPAIYLLGSYV